MPTALGFCVKRSHWSCDAAAVGTRVTGLKPPGRAELGAWGSLGSTVLFCKVSCSEQRELASPRGPAGTWGQETERPGLGPQHQAPGPQEGPGTNAGGPWRGLQAASPREGASSKCRTLLLVLPQGQGQE